MKQVISNPQFLVIDDFLNVDHFRLVWRYLQNEPYQHIHQEGIVPVFRTTDGNALVGRTVYAAADRRSDRESFRALVAKDSGALAYPAEVGADIVVAAILRRTTSLKPWIGERSGDWRYLTATAWAYPQGTALSWHRDGEFYTGAYIYYGHEEWNVTWGGELLIADERIDKKRNKKLREQSTMHQFDNDAENKHLLTRGVGQYVMPKPNRLIVLSAGYTHAIAPIRPAAGRHVRASVSGFFIRRDSSFLG